MNFLPFISSILALLALFFSMQSERTREVFSRVQVEQTAWHERRRFAADNVTRTYEKLGHSASSSSPKKAKASGSSQTRNLPCCRLNIAPLLRGDAHAPTHTAALRLLRAYYPQLEAERFLREWIHAAKGAALPLEQVPFEPHGLYYDLLKGKKGLYPPLTELFCIDEGRMCLRHATTKFIQALFGVETGQIIYEEIHPVGKRRTAVEPARLKEICGQHGELEPIILELVESKQHSHKRVRWQSQDESIQRLFPPKEERQKTAHP